MEKEEEDKVISAAENGSMKSVPLDIVFILEGVQLAFKEKLKLQIAFYRSIAQLIILDAKIAKTAPAKYLKAANSADPSKTVYIC